MRSPSEVVADMRLRLSGIRGIEIPTEDHVKWQRRGMLAISIIPLLGIAFAAFQVWGWGLTGLDVVLFLVFYTISGLGITVGFHRLLTHKSFDVPNWVRVGWATAGSMAIQGSAIDWVATHRRHHAYSDEEGDPHSPHLEAADGDQGHPARAVARPPGLVVHASRHAQGDMGARPDRQSRHRARQPGIPGDHRRRRSPCPRCWGG